MPRPPLPAEDHPTRRDTASLRREIKLLSVQSNLRGFSAIARDLLAIGLVIYLDMAFDSLFTYALTIWVIGALQFAMSECLLHEAAHRNLFRSRRLNDLCEIFVGLPFFQTIASYRVEHRLHHIYLLQQRDRLCEEYESYGLNRKNLKPFWIWFVKPLIGYSAIMMKSALMSKQSARDWIKITCFWAALLSISFIYGALSYVVIYWAIPLVFCKGAFLYWSEISDHYRTRSGTRTRLGRVSNFVFHNNGYHHAHHRYPGVPGFNLKKAHGLCVREGDDMSSGLIETYRQIRAG